MQQTALLLDEYEPVPKNKAWEDQELNSHDLCMEDKLAYASNFKHIEKESNKAQAKRLIQKIGNRTLVINPPYITMTEKEMDMSYDLPYTRLPHPKYKNRGPIPSFEMIKFSLNIHRGCFEGVVFVRFLPTKENL